jgi:tripartite-type tricarboxylate transporter receptor subunit TctC
MQKSRLIIALGAFAVVTSTVSGALAGSYPSKPITMIIPWKPGGTTETMGQVLSKAMAKELGQKVIVKTRPGGGGAIGSTVTAKSKPDGYTIEFVGISTLTWPPLTQKAIKYKTSDFEFIAGVSQYQMALVATPDKSFKTLKELVAYSKANPGVNVADMGGMSKAFVNFIAAKEAVDWTAIPTRGGGEMIPFILGGKVDFAYSGGIHQKYGEKLFVLASLLSNRLPLAPNAPSTQELYGVAMPGDNGIVAPKGIPEEARAKLEAAVKASMDDPDFTKILERIKFPKRYLSSKEFQKVVDETLVSLEKVGRATGYIK